MRKSNYSQEFRESTIKFCIDNSDRSISSIARDLGLNKGTLALWVNDYKAKNNLLPINDLKNETLELLGRKEFGQRAYSHLVTWRIMIWPLCAFEREPRYLYDARL